jgi:hypothetical protein
VSTTKIARQGSLGTLSCLSLSSRIDTDDHWARYLEVTVWYLSFSDEVQAV